jgi:hypothetical protein
VAAEGAGDLKVIQDTVHGAVRASPLVLELVDTPEVQRLRHIKQLGLANLVFPGANHTRFEHSFGAGTAAGRMAEALRLPEEEKALVVAACQLHDLGHGPYSHTLEPVLHKVLGFDHMDITKRIIRGEDGEGEARRVEIGGARIPDILASHGLDPDRIADLIKGAHTPGLFSFEEMGEHRGQRFFAGAKRYLAHVVHGTIDADQIDYLLRDAHHTGVAYGVIDFDRLLHTMVVRNGSLAFHRKGVAAVESVLVARGLMYSSVYLHKTTRIAEVMMARAVEMALEDHGAGKGKAEFPIQRMVDAEFDSWLSAQRGPPGRIARLLKYRALHKRCHDIKPGEFDERLRDRLLELCDPLVRREAEHALWRKARIPPGSAFLDIPRKELLLSEPRIAKTEVPMLDGARIVPLSRISTLASALRTRETLDWVLMVCAEPKHAAAAARAARSLLT